MREGSEFKPSEFIPKIEIGPEGTCKIKLGQITVDYDKPWKAAIRAAAPQTATDFKIWDLQAFQKESGGIENADITLCGFQRNWNIADAMGYQQQNNSIFANPQQVLAIGERYKTLNAALKMRRIKIVSFNPIIRIGKTRSTSKRRAISLWYEGDKRIAHADNIELDYLQNSFFAVLD
ncbi:MAG: hypothetical protein HYZ51_01730 [Candidatus Doudnabacteria bacterium]|nr:hypothetical protein [Candidatus Doudnabacteria bacterium]